MSKWIIFEWKKWFFCMNLKKAPLFIIYYFFYLGPFITYIFFLFHQISLTFKFETPHKPWIANNMQKEETINTLITTNMTWKDEIKKERVKFNNQNEKLKNSNVHLVSRYTITNSKNSSSFSLLVLILIDKK